MNNQRSCSTLPPTKQTALPGGSPGITSPSPELFRDPDLWIAIWDSNNILPPSSAQDRICYVRLSGVNQDGAGALATVIRMGGQTIVQDPPDCEIATMCESTKIINAGSDINNTVDH